MFWVTQISLVVFSNFGTTSIDWCYENSNTMWTSAIFSLWTIFLSANNNEMCQSKSIVWFNQKKRKISKSIFALGSISYWFDKLLMSETNLGTYTYTNSTAELWTNASRSLLDCKVSVYSESTLRQSRSRNRTRVSLSFADQRTNSNANNELRTNTSFALYDSKVSRPDSIA